MVRPTTRSVAFGDGLAGLAARTHAGSDVVRGESPPDPGQVVEVCGSTWAVANVQAQGLPRRPGDESRVIVSMAWLPRVRAQRLLRDVCAQTTSPKSVKRFAFDTLIVDRKGCTNGLG